MDSTGRTFLGGETCEGPSVMTAEWGLQVTLDLHVLQGGHRAHVCARENVLVSCCLFPWRVLGGGVTVDGAALWDPTGNISEMWTLYLYGGMETLWQFWWQFR